MNNIQITISAPELVEAMQALTLALQSGSIKPVQVEQMMERIETQADKPAKAAKAKEPKAEAPAPAPATVETKADAPEITLETVRAKLGQMSQQGKQDEVKALIASYGVSKLTAIDASLYGEILAKAEAL